jgi:hypothetical protein
MNRYPLLTYIALFSTVLPICAGTLKITTVDRGMKILFLYLLFAFTANIYLMWFARGYQLQVGLIHVYYLIEYLFMMSIISVWQESPRMKRFLQALILLYVLFWVIAKVTFEPLNGLYIFTATTSQVLLTLSAENTLIIVIGSRIQPIINLDRFWVLLSFVIYYTGTLLTIASRGILIHFPTKTLFIFISIDWSLKILFNILFTVGFLCPRTRT